MKCYLFMNMTSKRNSVISLETYENWYRHDDHLGIMCVKITELDKGALGKIKNTSKIDQRGCLSLLKFAQ